MRARAWLHWPFFTQTTFFLVLFSLLSIDEEGPGRLWCPAYLIYGTEPKLTPVKHNRSFSGHFFVPGSGIMTGISGGAASSSGSSMFMQPPASGTSTRDAVSNANSSHQHRRENSAGSSGKLPREVLDLLTGTEGSTRGDAASTASKAYSAPLPPMVPFIPVQFPKKPWSSNNTSNKNKSSTAKAASIDAKQQKQPQGQPPKPRPKWKWAPFTSSARSDGAVFCHWVKSHVEYPDYPYARFDMHLDPLAYTYQEYEFVEARLLQQQQEQESIPGRSTAKISAPQSLEWTRNDTEVLTDLVRIYDLRWPVVHDRYILKLDGNDSNRPSRTLEELQYRYYSFATTLIQLRTEESTHDELEAMHLVSPHSQQASDQKEEGGAALDHRAPYDPSASATRQDSGGTVNTTAAVAGGDTHRRKKEMASTPSSSAAAIRSAHVTPKAAQMALKLQQHRILHHFGTGTSTREFSLKRERERRQLLQVQWDRTLAEEQEEEQLLQELKLVDQQLRKLKKSGRHLLVAANGGGGEVTSMIDPEAKALEANLARMGVLGGGGVTMGDGLASDTSPTAGLDSAFSTAALPHHGIPYLQSARLGNPTTSGSSGSSFGGTKSAGLGVSKIMLKKMELTLEELDINLTMPSGGAASAITSANASRSTSPLPPSTSAGGANINANDPNSAAATGKDEKPLPLVPTKRVCDLYDSCRKQILILLSLQKVAHAREIEVATKRQRLVKVKNAAEAATSRLAAQKEQAAAAAAAAVAASSAAAAAKAAKAQSKAAAASSQTKPLGSTSAAQAAAAATSAKMAAATAKATAKSLPTSNIMAGGFDGGGMLPTTTGSKTTPKSKSSKSKPSSSGAPSTGLSTTTTTTSKKKKKSTKSAPTAAADATALKMTTGATAAAAGGIGTTPTTKKSSSAGSKRKSTSKKSKATVAAATSLKVNSGAPGGAASASGLPSATAPNAAAVRKPPSTATKITTSSSAQATGSAAPPTEPSKKKIKKV
jgi:hypothetical protein